MIVDYLNVVFDDLNLVPIILIIAAIISLVVSKKHIYHGALLLASVALFTIAIGWLLPVVTLFVFNYDFEKEHDALVQTLGTANEFSTIILIIGHLLLAISMFKFRKECSDK